MIIASLYPCPFDTDILHDYNSAIIKGSEIYAYEEDKLTGVKMDNTMQFAERSLMTGCKQLGILPSDIDHWVMSTPKNSPRKEDFFVLFNHLLKAFDGTADEFGAWFDSHVHFCDHHMAHAALGVFASGFEECAFVCYDGGGGGGDRRNFVFGDFQGGSFVTHGENDGYESAASFHAYVTDSLGFDDCENGKTSGLAAYGSVQPDLYEQFSSLLKEQGIGIRFDRQRLGRTAVNPARLNIDEYRRSKIFVQFPSITNVLAMTVRHLPHDAAATCEAILQEKFLALLKRVRARVRSPNAVFGGGIFQNVALNNAILESGLFDNVYFNMASNDSGNALGAALYVRNLLNPNSARSTRHMTPYLGPSFGDSEIESVLERFRLNYTKEDDISGAAAQLVADGKVVGWFQGRAEYGPRSLGSRSIVADPRFMKSKLRINQILKRRDWFMPYAPAILADHMEGWLKLPIESPYMQMALQVRDEKRHLIPAAVHVDGSARVQTVDVKDNEAFWRLIDKFREITGVPVLLNTSFNRHGVPTIATPRQAIEHLLEGDLDYLAIGPYLVGFEENRRYNETGYEEMPEAVCLALDCVKRLDHVLAFGSEDDIVHYLRNLGTLMGVELGRSDGIWEIDGSSYDSDEEARATLVRLARAV